jgi:hypothetical protein
MQTTIVETQQTPRPHIGERYDFVVLVLPTSSLRKMDQ